MSTNPTNTTTVLEFKSSTFFAPILILFNNDIAAIELSLQEKIRLAPDFFKNSPLMIDVSELNKHNHEIDIVGIAQVLRKIGLFPVGLRGGNEQQNNQARSLFIPIDTVRANDSPMSFGKTQEEEAAKQPAQPKQETTEAPIAPVASSSSSSVATTLITHPVRSGQRVYAAGDLIILSQVSAGAEIMAEGNIHVYNTLRGRALAGVQGKTDARIFCFDLQAELISIAGDYKTSEDLNKQIRKKPVQIYLQNHALIIQEIA
jgi:septum site-determining protein MinC